MNGARLPSPQIEAPFEKHAGIDIDPLGRRFSGRIAVCIYIDDIEK